MSRANLTNRTRRFAATLLLALALACGGLPATAVAALAPPSITAPAAALMTIDGVPLWSRAPLTQRRVASTIKMLNALVVRERASLDETVVVAAKAAAIEEGDVGLVAGQRLTVRQLLDMMLIVSANDAAEALAIHIGGTEARYVALMNAKARKLGLTGTYATDPHGLGKRERSNAQDLSVLARRVLADPVLRGIVRKQSVLVPRPGKKAVVLRSTYHLLGGYAGIEGVKTGYTRPAGFCFVGAAKRGGVELVGVVLGASSNKDRFVQMRRLLDWGFAHTHVRELVSSTTTIAVAASVVASQSAVATAAVLARPARAVSMALLDGSGPITRRVRPESLRPLPVLAGQQVALLDLRLGSRLLATVPLVALADVSVPATIGALALSTRALP